MEASISITSPPQHTKIDLDEPVTQLLYPDEPQDVEMAVGSDSQEMLLRESQTSDGGGQKRSAHKLSYNNTILDITSPWARSCRRHDIEGGEVFYHPKVSLTIILGYVSLTGPPNRLSHPTLLTRGIKRWRRSTPVSIE